MGQVIDIEERRRPRHSLRMDAEPAPGAVAAFGPADMGVMSYPALTVWRFWMASWATLWLAPMGLQVMAVELPPADRRDLARPHP
jgi:hypothetical protein